MTKSEREALRAIAGRLSTALGYADVAEEPYPRGALWAGASPVGDLSEEDERLTGEVRAGLERVANAVAVANPRTGAPRKSVAVALDGIELVLRGELASGNGAGLGALMPGFVFLATAPIVEQDAAIELSRRTASLVKRSATLD